MINFKRMTQINPSVFRAVLIIVLLSLFLIPIQLRLSPYANDDAYIHLRIANNLAHLGVPYFNPDEPIMASTSPAWTIFLAVLIKVLPFSVRILSVINALFCIAGALVYTHFLQIALDQEFSTIKYCFFIVLYICLLFQSSVELMEMPCTLLMAGIGLLFLIRKKDIGFTFLAAAIFFRPEAVLYFIFASLYSIKNKQFSIRAVIYSLIGLLPFVFYDLYFFHTFIPNTIIAKSIVYESTHLYTICIIINSFLPKLFLFHSTLQIPLITKVGYFSIWLLISGLVFINLKRKRRLSNKDYSILFLLLIPGTALVVLYVLVRTLVFSWYVPLYSVFILFGFFGVLFQNKFKDEAKIIGFASLPILALTFLFVFQDAWSAYRDYSLGHYFEEGGRVRKYIEVGDRLYKEYPDARLLSSEIGGLGWGFKGYILDGVGLVTPQALKYHPMSVPEERSGGLTGSIPTRIVIDLKPEIIVSYDNFIEDLIRSPVLQEYVHYQEPVFVQQDLALSPTGIVFNSRHLNIFIRKDFILKTQ